MEVKLPQLAEGVEGGTVVSILVTEGQEIKKDQAIMELETQKAVGSIPSPSSGIVTKVHVKQGMEVNVGQLLISIEGGGAQSVPAAKPPQAPSSSAVPGRPADVAGSASQSAMPTGAADKTPEDYRYESKTGAPPPAAPSIRKMAREIGLDLTRVRGSEGGGRINLNDVRAYIQRLQENAGRGPAPSGAAQPTKTPTTPSEAVDFSKWGSVRREKLSPLRRTVSRRMVESWTSIPKINQFWDADVTSLLALRKKHAGAYEKKGAHLTLTSFLLFVLARALKRHPRANSSLDESSQEIIYKDYVHIGVAVDTEGGLIVPVLRNVDQKTLLQLSEDLHALTEKTRQRKVSIEELQGGTFTISNQGSIGGSHFTPIIYAPQAAILGVGQGQAQPVAIDGKIAVRTILPLCLAYDHRVLDGADAVRFLKDIIAGVEGFDESDLRLK